MRHSKILLLGGSGFIGKQLAFALANRGYKVMVPCRRPHRHRDLRVNPGISVTNANVLDSEQLDLLCQDQDVVINLVGILHERKPGDFRSVHVELIKSIVAACSRNHIKRLLHLSAVGADQATGSSLYLRSKGEGENLLHTFGQKDLQVTSFQPSIVFGENDAFINRFKAILKMSIGFFPLACPGSQFAPVYVGDLITRICESIDDSSTYGQRYPVCGPEIYTFQQVLELIVDTSNLSCRILPLSDSLSKLQALVLQNLPGKLFTMDNFRSLQTPSICHDCELCSTSLSHYLRRSNKRSDRTAHHDISKTRQQSETGSIP